MSPELSPAEQRIPAPSRSAYWGAVSNGDSPGAIAVVMDLRGRGVSLLDVLEGLVTATQARVGRLWADNVWNVAMEHRATSVGEDVVAALAAAPRNGRRGVRGRAVVTCCDGEWHSLPSRVVATAMRDSGWQVDYLGASVPVSHLAQFLHDSGADVTAVSCSLPTALPRAREMIEASRQIGAPVIVGGAGFGPGGKWGLALGANGTAAAASSVDSVLDAPTWPAYTSPAPPLPSTDGAADLLWRHRRRLVSSAYRRLGERFPAVGSYDSRQLARTEEDLGYLFDFLAAALYVDDAVLYSDFISWMADLLEARNVPRRALTAGLRSVGEAVDLEIGPQPRTQRILAEATAVSMSGSRDLPRLDRSAGIPGPEIRSERVVGPLPD